MIADIDYNCDRTQNGLFQKASLAPFHRCTLINPQLSADIGHDRIDRRVFLTHKYHSGLPNRIAEPSCPQL